MIMGNNDSKKRKVLSDEELEQVSGGSLRSNALSRSTERGCVPSNCPSLRTKEECEQDSRCEWVYQGVFYMCENKRSRTNPTN